MKLNRKVLTVSAAALMMTTPVIGLVDGQKVLAASHSVRRSEKGKLRLKHNSYVYTAKGKQTHKLLRKDRLVKYMGKVKKNNGAKNLYFYQNKKQKCQLKTSRINGKDFYQIGKNQYIKVANVETIDGKTLIIKQNKVASDQSIVVTNKNNVPVYSFEAEESKSSELAKGTELQVNGAIYLWNDKVQRADLYYHLTNRKHVDAGDVFVKASDVDYKSGKKLTPINTAEEAENNYKIAVSELDEITLKDLINKENTVKASTKYKKASSDKKYNYEQAVSEAKTATMAKDIMSAAQAKYLIWSLKTYESELDG